ncbi:MAG: response regulator [Campylobacterota bacterium]|nr:response regulator [Campylobacterota bacterium]
MKKSVLIVEDETIVAMEIESYILHLGCHVAGIASNAKDAYTLAMQKKPDLILMDINLKGTLDGIEAAAKIKSEMDVLIIYLTAFSDNATIERAITTAPSAYLAKPFNRQELFAAIKIAFAQIKKINTQNSHTIKLDEEFHYNSNDKQLFCKGEHVDLTQQEKRLFELLIASQNTTLDIYTVENTLWPDKMPNENRRRALISRLRTKLKHQFLETLSGIGYRLNF